MSNSNGALATYEALRDEISSALKSHARYDRTNQYRLARLVPNPSWEIQIDDHHRVGTYLPIVAKRKSSEKKSWRNLGGLLTRPSLVKVATIRLGFSYDPKTRSSAYNPKASWDLTIFGERNVGPLEKALKPVADKYSGGLNKRVTHKEEASTGRWEVR